MANRVVEVFYKLKDLFTGQVKKITGGYRDIERASKRTASSVEASNSRSVSSFDRLAGTIGKIRSAWFALSGVIAAGGALRGLKQFADEADKVGKLSQKLGVASDELSALGYAAERSNISFDTMSTALQRLIRRAAEAANGTGEARDALRTLGIDAKEFTQLSLEEKMATLADAMQGVGDQGQRVALAMKLFDTEGVAMVNVLQDGGEAMRGLMNEARELGYVFDEETTEAARKFNDTLTRLSATASGIGRSAAAPALEWVNDLAAKFNVSADRASNLRAQLEYLDDRLNNRLSFSPYDYFVSAQALTGVRDLRAEYEAVAAELAEIEKAQRKKVETDKEAVAVSADLKAEMEDQARIYKSVAESADAQLKARKDALSKETDELRKAKAEQLSIEREFKDLVAEVNKPDQQDVSLGDVFYANTKARAAAARGETDEAIRLAKEGGDLLGLLKEKGTETQGTLSFLAKQLQQVATEAAKAKTDKEGADVLLAQNAVQTYQAQLEQLKNTAKSAGNEAGIAYAQAMQDAMSRFDLQAPAVNAPRSSPIYPHGNNYFSDREFDQRGAK